MVYQDEKLNQISFPLGGIGTGSIGLAGNGSLIDWEIFNRPNKGSISAYSCFVIKAEFKDGSCVVKVLQGDWTRDLMGQYSKEVFAGFGFGPKSGTMCGFPHFEKVTFDGKFPIATLTFEDAEFPGIVVMKAFNPFIPLNADDSSIPAAFFDITVKNNADDVKYTILFSVRNPFEKTVNESVHHETYTAIMLKNAEKTVDEIGYGDITIAVEREKSIYQEYWYRGAWQDGVMTFWHDVNQERLHNRKYDSPATDDVCTVGAEAKLHVGEEERFRFILSWNIPNNYNFWNEYKNEAKEHVVWKNYYARMFSDSTKSAFYALENWDRLYKETERFCESIHGVTLDEAVIDAVSSTLSVLKTPTVLRLEDGSFYGWEGANENVGSCEGTCTHVWSYAYALCFLFPELEKSIRNIELKYNTDDNGKMQFRTNIPLERGRMDFYPCVDGQMATVIKVYRDWKITGDTEWLKSNWDNVKRILEFAWSTENEFEWDKDKDGVLEGRQHHTLDMELFGPSSWLEGMYLAALKAAAEIATYLEDYEKQQEYMQLFKTGYEWTKENLFNGNYFIQKIDLKQKTYTEHFKCSNYWNEEKQQLKYQIGEVCEIDQMLAQWHANLCGLGDIFDVVQRKKALKSMLSHNYKKSLRTFVNSWRVFALNDESGCIMCDYPQGVERPVIPIPYAEECMTGFEYAFAGLLISEGLIEEGINVIRAIRARYDGEKRNPWNEIECGSNYARAMSSFALLPIFSGLEFDLPNNYIGFSPILENDFKCFWSLGTGCGVFIRTAKEQKILLHSGYLMLSTVKICKPEEVKEVAIDGKKIEFERRQNSICFNLIRIEEEICFVM